MANLLKQFFKKLKTDLIPIDVMEFLLIEMGKLVLACVSCNFLFEKSIFAFLKENESPNMDTLRDELNNLDPLRRDTLRFVLRHLYLWIFSMTDIESIIAVIHSFDDSVAAHKHVNFVTVHKLAIAWSPFLFRSHYAFERSTNGSIQLLTFLIENYKLLLTEWVTAD